MTGAAGCRRKVLSTAERRQGRSEMQGPPFAPPRWVELVGCCRRSSAVDGVRPAISTTPSVLSWARLPPSVLPGRARCKHKVDFNVQRMSAASLSPPRTGAGNSAGTERDCCRGPHRSTYAIRVNKKCHLAVLPVQTQARPFFSRSDSLLARVRPIRLDQPNRYRHSTGSLLCEGRASRRLEGGAFFGLPCTSRFSGRRVFVEFSAAATTVHGATTHGRGVAAISAVWLITRCRLEHRKFRFQLSVRIRCVLPW